MTSSQQPVTSVQRRWCCEQRSRLCSTLTATLEQNVNNCFERADYQNLKWINRPSVILKECIAKSIAILKMVFGRRCKDAPIQQHHVGIKRISWLPKHVELAACWPVAWAWLLQDSLHWGSLGCKRIKYQQCVFLKTDANCIAIIKKATTLLKTPPVCVTAREACGEAKQLHFSCQQCIAILSHRSITRVTDICLKTPTLKNVQLF